MKLAFDKEGILIPHPVPVIAPMAQMTDRKDGDTK